MNAIEANIDGLVGPTHNYAGLSFGNIASQKHALSISNPRQAALQGLRKMKFMHDLGIPQMVMPPQLRPDMEALKRLGFASIIYASAEALNQVYSASSMWVANAATISPSADTADGKVHITPANLVSKFHRSIEPATTAHYLKQIFSGSHFVHHDPLPSSSPDEGAANHMRLSKTHAEKGIEIFVYGGNTTKYPARQSLQASEAIAKLHGLEPAQTLFLQQSAKAIDAGVFHNDVIAMSNEHLFIYHEDAYENLPSAKLGDYTLIRISANELPLEDAVKSYFFNSQLVTLPSGQAVVIAPKECEEIPKTKACFNRLINEGHIAMVHYLDVRESMKNGGGPACLRLRVVLNDEELKDVAQSVRLNDELYNTLCRWIETYYRDRITPNDLRDAALKQESYKALEELSGIIKIKTVGMA